VCRHCIYIVYVREYDLFTEGYTENADEYVREVGGLGSSTIFKNLMSPTPRRNWYLTTERRAH